MPETILTIVIDYPKETNPVYLLKYMGINALYFDHTDKNLKKAKGSWGWERMMPI